MTLKNQSPNMFSSYPDSGNYDLVMVNWYCETDALNTYWAVHQFSTNQVDGYGGFQNADGNHILMFSIWDHGSNYPVVEYVSAKAQLDNLTFGSEGNGKHIVTEYAWEVGVWYTMCIGTKTVAGKTYYAQWVAKKDSNNWFLCGVISYPVANRYIGSDLMFQEDFMSNNYVKKCRLQDAFARYNGTSNWHVQNSYYIHNNFYKYHETTSPQSNFKYDCDFGTDRSATYVYIQAGGEDLTNPVERTMDLPTTLTIISGSNPTCYPSWADITPRYILNKYTGKYVSPDSYNTVVQGSSPYYWNFVDSGDGYFYILNDDKTLAITISGTSDGSDLVLSPFNSLDTQKWTSESFEQSEYSYFIPKNAPSMNMDVEGPSFASGAAIQLWAHSSTAEQFMWLTLNESIVCNIKSNFSGLYVNPSATAVVQSSNDYRWNMVSANDDYFYLLTLDNTKAITVNSTVDGADLVMTDFDPGNNNQKWKLMSATGGRYYIVPKANVSKTMDVEGPVTAEGAPIQLWTRSSGVSQFMWFVTTE